MADKKISQLPAATTPLSGTEEVPLVQSGTTKKVLVSDLAGGGLPEVEISTSTSISAAVDKHYILTAATAATVTLPASPSIGDTIFVTVANGLTTNVVARNGKPIQGIAEDLTLDALYASVQLRFTDDTEGWIFA